MTRKGIKFFGFYDSDEDAEEDEEEDVNWWDACSPDELSCEDGDEDHFNGDLG